MVEVMYKLSNDFLLKDVKDEAVILNIKTGDYFGLNEVGAILIRLLLEGKSISQVTDLITDEFDADIQTVESDCNELIGELLSRGIIYEE